MLLFKLKKYNYIKRATHITCFSVQLYQDWHDSFDRMEKHLLVLPIVSPQARCTCHTTLFWCHKLRPVPLRTILWRPQEPVSACLSHLSLWGPFYDGLRRLFSRVSFICHADRFMVISRLCLRHLFWCYWRKFMRHPTFQCLTQKILKGKAV